MARQINRAETWETVYQAYRSINFSAYTYDSMKQALIDYIREYHGELFNDMIESSELIATIETFAYVCEALSYRYDMLAHESAMTTAQRKESILKHARFLSYNASRNIPARGLLKISSITTSETIYDSTGTNLANAAIRWNDPVVENWRERFHLVMNRALAKEYGNVTPTDRVQINDVLFEQYNLNTVNTPTSLSYTVSFGGETYDMEVVSSILTPDGPEERRPHRDMPFAVLFADDGDGDDSSTTGFFCYTKQGSLRRRELDFNNVMPNHSFKLDVDGVNNTDVWLNQIDADGRLLRDVNNTVIGDWQPLDSGTAYSVIFNTSDQRRLYEVETRDRDRIRVVFGDGEFSDIPSGKFELWYRVSEFEQDIVIPRSAISEQTFTIAYADATGQMQTLRFTLSATSSFQNAASSESIERIRRTAPAAYYAQHRMVNGKDYNVFPLKDNSILKLRTVNRTFAGDSKYIQWHDPTGSYENVKMYGNDLTLYHETEESTISIPDTIGPEGIVSTYVTPLLRSADIMARFVYEYAGTATALKSTFTPTETADFVRALREIRASAPGTVYGMLTGSAQAPTWRFTTTRPNDTQAGRIMWWFKVTTRVPAGWDLTHITKKLVAHSPTTKFWNTNTTQNVVYDSYRPVKDRIIILAANISSDNKILTAPVELDVYAAYQIATGPNRGLPDTSRLVVAPADTSRDGIPDNLGVEPVFPMTNGVPPTTVAPGEPPAGPTMTDSEYVYFTKEEDGTWKLVDTTVAIIRAYYEQFGWTYNPSASAGQPVAAPSNTLTSVTGRKVVWKYGAAPGSTIKREVGRRNLNFLWTHFTPRYHLIDPAPSNINDMFIVTRGYQQHFEQWLSGRRQIKPQPPTPVELRMAYKPLLDNKMISDTVVFLPAKFKTIINGKSDPQLRARLKVVKGPETLLTNSEIKVRIIEACREFFDLNKWELGERFHFTSLSTAIHNHLGSDIDSVVIVPTAGDGSFGDGFQIDAREDEIIYGFVTPSDIDIVTSLDRSTLKQLAQR